MMIRIAICDDDKEITYSIKKHLESKGKLLQDESLSIFQYQSGVDFLRDVEQGTYFHIAFMDIEMKERNGIEIGHSLRSHPGGDEIVMIYISAYENYFEALARVSNFSFIRKPLDMDIVDEVFSHAFAFCLKLKNGTHRAMLFHDYVGNSNQAVKIEEIVYMKTDKHILEIYIWDKQSNSISYRKKIYSSIAQALEKLPKNQFIQCGRSYLVNLDYVNKLRYTYLTFIDQDMTSLPIGRTHIDNVKKAYLKWRGL
ncbi:MAG: LytTR family DNA-binding domain-containing protein [Defluviitaleaceae bacterium]|nr:LytTR family DNA-binding domain-containing protein [Defluviitaleaceae bacterium]